jgi:DNA-binding NarL/FixJ family response regulator
MPIKVLLADDTDVLRSAIRKTLEEEPRIQLVGEAASFAKAVQLIADCKPDVLLLDLNLPEKRSFKPELVKAQLRCVCTLAVSLSNDAEAKELAESYGAVSLLDEMSLYSEMIPAIMRCSDNQHFSASASRAVAVGNYSEISRS